MVTPLCVTQASALQRFDEDGDDVDDDDDDDDDRGSVGCVLRGLVE